jgi:hypothetical protein
MLAFQQGWVGWVEPATQAPVILVPPVPPVLLVLLAARLLVSVEHLTAVRRVMVARLEMVALVDAKVVAVGRVISTTVARYVIRVIAISLSLLLPEVGVVLLLGMASPVFFLRRGTAFLAVVVVVVQEFLILELLQIIRMAPVLVVTAAAPEVEGVIETPTTMGLLVVMPILPVLVAVVGAEVQTPVTNGVLPQAVVVVVEEVQRVMLAVLETPETPAAPLPHITVYL